MLRAIQEIKPTYVIAENVFGITNIDGGLVFEQVCIDLENQGYEVQPFIIPAASKNAPHRRDRVWFVATNTNCNGLNQCNCNNEKHTSERRKYAQCDAEQIPTNFQNFPTQSPICSGDDGLPTELDGITFSKWRAESIKGYGNAIVPQVAYEIFKQL
jgi:DNA (cytosine-5)-methyltransferase 1